MPIRHIFIRSGLWVVLIAGLLAGRYELAGVRADERAPDENRIDFTHDVQPILRLHCYRCHGSKNQKGGLQLNRRAAVYGNADSGEPIVVKQQADSSLLIKRLVDEDLGDLMPLDGEALSQQEIKTLRFWIDQGAAWPDELAEGKHWAYQPIVRPDVPAAGARGGQPIDQFIKRRLDQQGLEFSPPADRARLIRRVALALTGLPPSPQEVHDFVIEDAPDAYEKMVDRLLESPRYGERWAVPWLDLARYADSNGFQADQIRDNWAYRDWVIRAFNADLPYDQFVIDQIAGDLRPDATTDQKIATGFHRMTTCNVEAGVHPEANRTNQIIDRVNTTATVFLGTTLECAQCHDHKYDPFSQKDYYQLFAYFNNTPLEVKNTAGVTWDFYGPKMNLPMDEAKENQRQTLQTRLAGYEQDRQGIVVASNAEYMQWLAAIRKLGDPSKAWQRARPEKFESSGGEEFTILDDGAVLLSGSVPDTADHIFTFAPQTTPITAIRIDVLTDDSIEGKGPGRGDAVRSNIILSELTCELISEDGVIPLDLENAVADFSQTKWDVANAIDGNRKTGWAISPQFGKPHWAAFAFSEPVVFDRGVNPEKGTSPTQLRVTLGQYYGRGRVIAKPRISFFTQDPALIGLDASMIELANKKNLKPKEKKTLRAEFEKRNPRLQQLDQRITRTKRELEKLQPDTTLVMQEMDQPRETFVLTRGEYDNPAEKVAPGFPEVLPQAIPIETTGNRLELAYRLTSRDNPLLSRVTVNRWWGELFGTGLVNTPEDFGTQAEDPSHPQLLDWLASELMDSDWSMKHIHKTIVMSATFQQSSKITPQLLEADPKNRLLARGPRFRLSAELVRDNALAISGLFSDKMFGPPIMPFQPDNLWRSVGRNQPKWEAAENENRFRRGVYVVWKRAAPYPSFINFDAPDRGSCTVRRGRSNTPLQALTLLNDPAYAEMALAMADRILSQSPRQDDAGRIDFAIRLALARAATDKEIRLLQTLLEHERAQVKNDNATIEARTKTPFADMKLRTTDKAELAAWFAIANVLLNLDETISQ